MSESTSKKLENLDKEEARCKEKLKEIRADRVAEKKRIRASEKKKEQAEALELIQIAKNEKVNYDLFRGNMTIYEYLVAVKKERDEKAKMEHDEEVKKQLDKEEDANKRDGENTYGINKNSAGAMERPGEA